MAALLVAMSVMAVLMSVLLPVWNTAARREREAELIFRGEQYARAIRLFGMRYGNALPPNVDVLVNERFLRKKYKDPITGDDFQLVGPGGFAPGPQGEASGRRGGASDASGSQQGAADARRALEELVRRTGGLQGSGRSAGPPGGRGGRGTITSGVAGVVSKSTEQSLRLYNGRGRYNEWVFMATQASTQAGGPPGGPAGVRGGRGDAPRGGPGTGSGPGRGEGPRGSGPAQLPRGGPQFPRGRQ